MIFKILEVYLLSSYFLFFLFLFWFVILFFYYFSLCDLYFFLFLFLIYLIEEIVNCSFLLYFLRFGLFSAC